MRPPIIVVTDDTDVFSSVRNAEGYLEPQDVEHGQATAFDADGRVLAVNVRVVRAFLGGREWVELAETDELDEEGLRRVLERFLSHPRHLGDRDLSAIPLDELVAAAARFPTL